MGRSATPLLVGSSIEGAGPSIASKTDLRSSYDVIVVGSGIGGLTCAAMLARYGYSVLVLESHSEAGGAAHGFTVRDRDGLEFHFDTGPSFFSGLNPNVPLKASNPLRCVLEAIDEKVDCIPYSTFGLIIPEGEFVHTPDFGRIGGVLDQALDSDDKKAALEEWESLIKTMGPLANAVAALPTLALRTDWAVMLTCAQFLPKLINPLKVKPWENLELTKPYSATLERAGVKNNLLLNWLDLLCFCLSGLPADGTITAEMAMMMGEFYEPDALMDCPRKGAKSIVAALVRGLEKFGGSIHCNSHVERINIEGGRAAGVTLRKMDKFRKNIKIQANKAVVSNLSAWDLVCSGIIDDEKLPTEFVREREATPLSKSFMHIHLAFRTTKEDLARLQAHYIYIEDWERGVQSDENVALVSIPSVHDDSLAPSGYAVLHAYTPATEDYERWRSLDRKSGEYTKLKEERCEYLWKVLERIIPDIRKRSHIVRVGTPLTHERFLRRYRGTYGPAIRAGEGSFPFPRTPIEGLLVCGDSCFPGIGVPAVAGSGLLAANSVSIDSLRPQMQVLEELRSMRKSK